MSKIENPQALERRIATALDSSDIEAADLAVLIDETEVAITSAAEAERAKALDPIASPDAAKAHVAMDDAAFMRERLRTVLPRLQQRYQEVMAHEYHAQWEHEYEAVKVEHDALAAEFGEVYRQAVAKLVDLLSRMTLCDRACHRVNASAPAGEPRRLVGPELAARDLERFTIADPSIMKELKLPDFARSERMAWPPPQTLDSFLFSPVSASPRRYSADWGLAAEDEARASRERQERDSAKREAETQSNWRGPRWWKGERV